MNKSLNDLHALEVHEEFLQFKARQIDENRKLSRRLDYLEDQFRDLKIAVKARDDLINELRNNKEFTDAANKIMQQYDGAIKNLFDK